MTHSSAIVFWTNKDKPWDESHDFDVTIDDMVKPAYTDANEVTPHPRPASAHRTPRVRVRSGRVVVLSEWTWMILLIHSLACSLTHSLARSLTHSPTHSLTHSLAIHLPNISPRPAEPRTETTWAQRSPITTVRSSTAHARTRLRVLTFRRHSAA